MTTQRRDFLYHDGRRAILAAAAPPPFAPADSGLHFGGWLGTDCCRGFHVDYESVDGTLRIRELHVSLNEADRAAVETGALFGVVPEFKAPLHAVYRHLPLKYTGTLIVRNADRRTAMEAKSDAAHGILAWKDGQLVSEQWTTLDSLPEDFIPESVWIDYGIMMWLPASTDSETR